MDDIVKSFNEYGISKDQADKILGKFAAMVPSDDDQRKEADARYQEEMNKLGSERNKILADLRSFTDTMIANKIWDDGQKKIFYDAVTSADAAKMFHSAIENFKVLGAGVFSSTQPAQHPAASQRTSQQESIDLYRRAFQLAKTNPLDGELELKKLDKLLGLK
jgi:hypothetical protein